MFLVVHSISEAAKAKISVTTLRNSNYKFAKFELVMNLDDVCIVRLDRYEKYAVTKKQNDMKHTMG